MASPRTAWGIDIGNRALKAVKLVRSGDGVRVDDFEFIEHETILSQAGDNRDELIKKSIAEFMVRKGTRGSAVAIGVSGQTSFARFIKLPPVEPKRIPEIVRFEAIQQIPFPLEDVEWSYQLFNKPDDPEIEVGIFAMRKELVNAQVKLYTDVNLDVQAVQTLPLAVYNAVQFDNRLGETVAMIIDVGAETTDLIIGNDHSIWHRSIPIGGNNFTEVLTKAFKITTAKAEELKRDAQSSKYMRQIFSAMRPVFADLVAEIQRSVGFYGSVNRGSKIEKIIALGGTFRLPALPKYLEQNLQLPVERPDTFGAGMPADTKVAAAMTENILSLHGAYGLALQAMEEAKITSSLLPASIRREKMWKEKTKWFATAAALVGVGAFVGFGRYFLEDISYSRNQGVRDENARVLSEAQARASEFNTIAGGGADDRARIANLRALNEGAALWSDILIDIAKALPTPSPALAKALEAGDAEAIKAIPRGQRQLFRIEQLRSEYVTDINDAGQYASALGRLNAGTSSPMPGMPSSPGGSFTPGGPAFTGEFNEFGPAMGAPPPTEAPVEGIPGTQQRGFIVSMRLITPYEQAEEYADNQIKAALASIMPTEARPKLRYRVERVEILQSLRIEQDANYRARLIADHAARLAAETSLTGDGSQPQQNPGGWPGGAAGSEFDPFNPGRSEFGPGFSPEFNPNPQPNNPELSQEEAIRAALADPITGEDQSQDFLIDLVFRIAIDPPPYAPPAPAEPTGEVTGESTEGNPQ